MKIAVIGTGYVGLVVGACFADAGNQVICVDQNEAKIQGLRDGKIPFYEPGLSDLVRRGCQSDRLKFTQDTHSAVITSEVVFLAVNTPALPSGEPNLEYLKKASQEVARSMNGYKLIVNKSTVPIGAHEIVAQWIREISTEPFDVVSNPEFLKEGSAVEDFLYPDRVIIGTNRREAYDLMAELYSPFVRQGNPVIQMDPTSAEMTKYACNSFLAARISFMNEMALLCEKVGGSIEEVRKGMATDHRIGPHFLYAGVGYGGSCLPKDIQALLATARTHEVPLGVVQAAEQANLRQKRRLVEKVKHRFGNSLVGHRLAVWGLSFKPNTDDMREAPSINVIEELLAAGCQIIAYDPEAQSNARMIFGDRIQWVDHSYDALESADGLVIITEWNEFRQSDLERVKALLKQPVIFDGRNLFSTARMNEAGFEYYSIGRPSVSPT